MRPIRRHVTSGAVRRALSVVSVSAPVPSEAAAPPASEARTSVSRSIPCRALGRPQHVLALRRARPRRRRRRARDPAAGRRRRPCSSPSPGPRARVAVELEQVAPAPGGQRGRHRGPLHARQAELRDRRPAVVDVDCRSSTRASGPPGCPRSSRAARRRSAARSRSGPRRWRSRPSDPRSWAARPSACCPSPSIRRPGRHRVPAVGHHLEVEVADGDRLRQLHVDEPARGGPELRRPRRRRVGIERRGRARRARGGKPFRGARGDPTLRGVGYPQQAVDELVRHRGRESGHPPEPELTSGGDEELADEAHLVGRVPGRDHDRARPAHREHERVVERLLADRAGEVGRHPHDLVDPHVLAGRSSRMPISANPTPLRPP